MSDVSLLHPFAVQVIPFDIWVETGLDWLVDNYRPVFQAIRVPVDYTLTAIESGLQAVPALIVIAVLCLFAWQIANRKVALLTLVALVAIGLVGAWEQAMVTLALVITAVFFCVLIGLPLGILAAGSDRFERAIRPVLDAMQTTPSFVYLVPIVMLFGIGNVPGVVVTIIFAVAPLIRLTNLGIRQVPHDLIEACEAFGTSPMQMLVKVQLPLALKTIMAGLNQTLMLSLSMVVIASMISVGGLGQMVLRGIGRLDMGLAAVGGLGIVLLAIVIDRMTQTFATAKRRPEEKWYTRGPAGLISKALGRT